MKRVLIAAGGTGGHFYPGLVIALELRKHGWEPLLVVKKDDPAKPRLEAEGLACLEVDLGGMPRRPGPGLFVFAWKVLASMRLLSRVVRDFRPSLVLGMGGYLTFPCVWGAMRRGVPAALHEANAILGLANRASAALGARLFWGLPPWDGEGTVVGTPIRPALHANADRAKARAAFGLAADKKTILVFGGSQGAKAINAAVAPALKGAGLDAQILHLAGKDKAGEPRSAYKAAGIQAVVLDYCEDMASAYAAADVVVCRAGASTLAELAAQRKAAILVPYPHAAANHQDFNARVFEKRHLAMRISDSELGSRLGPALADLLKSTTAPDWSTLGLPEPERTTELFADELEKLS